MNKLEGHIINSAEGVAQKTEFHPENGQLPHQLYLLLKALPPKSTHSLEYQMSHKGDPPLDPSQMHPAYLDLQFDSHHKMDGEGKEEEGGNTPNILAAYNSFVPNPVQIDMRHYKGHHRQKLILVAPPDYPDLGERHLNKKGAIHPVKIDPEQLYSAHHAVIPPLHPDNFDRVKRLLKPDQFVYWSIGSDQIASILKGELKLNGLSGSHTYVSLNEEEYEQFKRQNMPMADMFDYITVTQGENGAMYILKGKEFRSPNFADIKRGVSDLVEAHGGKHESPVGAGDTFFGSVTGLTIAEMHKHSLQNPTEILNNPRHMMNIMDKACMVAAAVVNTGTTNVDKLRVQYPIIYEKIMNEVR